MSDNNLPMEDAPFWKALYTRDGLNLLAKLQRGDLLKISRAVAGAGRVDSNELSGQTAVTDPRNEFGLGSVTYASESRARIPAFLSNESVTQGYLLYQAGVYAIDPDIGEILYCIMQTETPDYIPTKTQLPGFVFKLGINLVFGSAERIDAKIDPAGMVSVEDLEAHNADPIAHGGLLQQLVPSTPLITITHNLGCYPRLLVLGNAKYSAGLGGAGAYPAGGTDLEELPTRAAWHDPNTLTVKTIPEIVALGTPELHQINSGEYTVTFTGNDEISLYVYLDTGKGEPPESIFVQNMVFSETPPQDKSTIWGKLK